MAPADQPSPGTLAATLPGGATLAIDLYPYHAAVGDVARTLPHAEALHAAIDAVWLSPEGLKAVLTSAERAEIGGNDVPRWKDTIVRHLLGAAEPWAEPVNREPFTLTFYVHGEPHVVQADGAGFTYASVCHERPGGAPQLANRYRPGYNGCGHPALPRWQPPASTKLRLPANTQSGDRGLRPGPAFGETRAALEEEIA